MESKTIQVLSSCIGCQACFKVCNRSVFRFDTATKKSVVIEEKQNDCINCGQCISVCPSASISHSDYPQWNNKESDHYFEPINTKLVKSVKTEAIIEMIQARRSVRCYKKELPLTEEDKTNIYKIFKHSGTAKNVQGLALNIVEDADLLYEMEKMACETMKMKCPPKGTKGPIFRGAPTMIFSIGERNVQPPNYNWAEIDSALAMRNIEFYLQTRPKMGSCYCGFITMATKANPKILNVLGIDGTKYYVAGAIMVGKTDMVYRTKVHRKERDCMIYLKQ